MNTDTQGQVQLFELIFTMSWEDPEIDRRALCIAPGETVAAVTSGACNVFSFLLDDPALLYAVDINASQSHLLELKMAALRVLDHPDLLAFLGIRPSASRLATFASLRGALSADAAAYWESQRKSIEAGILGRGRYEYFIRLFRKFLHTLQGRRRVERLFARESLEAQREYFDTVFNTARWRAIFPLFFNKRILARRGLSASYFQFDDGSASFAESFFRRAEHAMTALPARDNYFLSQYLLGRYLTEDAVPAYLREEHTAILRSRLDRVRVVSRDLKHWLSEQPDASIDCFALSNICELMDLADTEATFRQVARTSRPEGRMIFRNLMIPRTVPGTLEQEILRDDALSHSLRLQDRSFVYSRVDALRRAPASRR